MMQQLMTLSNACRQQGDARGEREAIDELLSIDPYFLPAHLARGDWIERNGHPGDAAAAYRHMLGICPPDEQWPAEYKARLIHAREIVDKHSESLNQHLRNDLLAMQSDLPKELIGRWDEAISIRAGKTAPYRSRSNQLHIPRLPAIPFFDRDQFPFLRQLEEQTEIIRDELKSVLCEGRDSFVPYIDYKASDPVNQWQELNHSDRWSALHLWQSGTPVQANIDHCPQTARALSNLPMAGIDGLCPNALFSALAPGTRIPPHHGETNARVVAHLPLIVPEKCKLRVGFEEREWNVGECLIFDDTIEHEARNDSDELRVVLIFDLWNPLLTETERRLASQLAKATREFGND